MYKINGRCLSVITQVTILLLTGACTSTATRSRVLSVPVASMTHSKLPLGYKLRPGKAVIAKFCKGDAPIVETGDIVGMVDQVLYKAQTENQATHLLDVLVMRDGNCLTAEANAAQAVKFKARSAAAKDFEWTTTILTPDSEQLTE